jgi:hypothetical protein
VQEGGRVLNLGNGKALAKAPIVVQLKDQGECPCP